MSVHKTGNRVHDDAIVTAESVRQAAAVPGATQAAVRTADITFYRAARASAIAQGLSPEPFIQALNDLGVGGV